MMVNSICQPDWVMGFLDTRLNVSLSLSVRDILDEIYILIGRLSKADCPLQCGWAYPVHYRPE